MTYEAAGHAKRQDASITAIDIALEPDETMVGHAREANAALRASFPAGFPLDATHTPHVTIFAAFVPTVDLPKVYAAGSEVLAKEKYTTWKLTAFKYYYIPLGQIGLAGIVVELTDDMLRLQQKLIDAVGHLTVKTATADAFYTTPAEPDIEPAVIEYIAGFANHMGKNFSPHVTIGVAARTFLDPMLAQPFSAFTFSPASASAYQLGNYGAARNKLKAL
jgi:2'-5' RNA ligase